ncbi:MAG: 50S ribosomal protein L11 methyltransferase [Deltaproteobacteria bacterium]|nr:50S ribosomal protein L11 methyltransferase [Deltaproteobacteria bacterium]
MSPSWLELSLRAPTAALDTISNFLIERGSPGVVLKRNEIRAFFARPAKSAALKRDIQRFLRGIKGIYPGVREEPLRWTILKDRNWNHSWRRFFSPQKVGRCFCVTPPWIDPPRSRRRQVITIEPGMAFGTGTHPTTRCCLEFLEETAALLTQEPITALDVGTGSGILAIALAKLGASKVLALDTDPVALKAARVNVRHNRVGRAVRLSISRLGSVKETFTVVVANLTAETITSLASLLQEKVSAGGYLILSGILEQKAPEVLRRFSPHSFVLARRTVQRQWVTLLLKKRE